MLFATKAPSEKRAEFRAALRSGKLLRFPGSFSPLVSLLIERQGFDGVYVSGAVLSADLGLPDTGLTTLSEAALFPKARLACLSAAGAGLRWGLSWWP